VQLALTNYVVRYRSRLLDKDAQPVGGLPVPLARGVLIDQRSAHRSVAHPVHRLARRGARGRSELVARVPPTLDALPELVSEPAMELFEKYRVFNHREMHSRYEVGLEQYTLTVGVEARLTLEMGSTLILPAAVRYQTELAQNVGALSAAGVEPDPAMLAEVSGPVSDLRAGLAQLRDGLAAEVGETAFAEAKHAQDVLLPAMDAVRSAADLLEGIVADDLWPLPTYQEMMFIL
jgi:glutamine synthetase